MRCLSDIRVVVWAREIQMGGVSRCRGRREGSVRGRETQVSGDLGAFQPGWEGSTEPHRLHCASAGGEEALGTGEGQRVTEPHTGIQTQRDSGKWAGASARRREQPHPRGRLGTPPRTAGFHWGKKREFLERLGPGGPRRPRGKLSADGVRGGVRGPQGGRPAPLEALTQTGIKA